MQVKRTGNDAVLVNITLCMKILVHVDERKTQKTNYRYRAGADMFMLAVAMSPVEWKMIIYGVQLPLIPN